LCFGNMIGHRLSNEGSEVGELGHRKFQPEGQKKF
jgi:hypothetical protein